MQIASLILLLLQVAILVPYMLRQLNKAILDPMNRVENGIDLVEKGHLDTKISNEPSCKEIEHLIDSFNGMISQISSLKVQAY
ncbi:MAG: HAMP domain-containing protein, partial [Clostridia bacterium]|nr:HAMP domain-containing protein [Clostridia bacterium]